MVALRKDMTQALFDQFLATLKYPPNRFQLKVLESIAFGSGNIIVNAKAGSGKTSLLKMIANLLKFMGVNPDDVLFQAFNKTIEIELNAQLPTGFTAKTSHALGFAMCREWAKQNGVRLGQISDRKYGEIALDIALELYPGEDEKADRYKARNRIESLIGKLMANDVDPNDTLAVEDLADHYAIEDITPNIIRKMPGAIDEAIRRFKERGEMGFIDMIYMPVKLGMQPKSRFSQVLVDECLPYRTPVQLADGTSMTIGDIVEQKLPVEVLAYDVTTGEQKACKVTGWSKTLNQKPLVKIKVKWTQGKPYKGGVNKPTNFVVCTTDHKIWANNQWIPAGDVRPGMVAQVETAAIKSQAYKITAEGRNTLSEVMAGKNEAGVNRNNNHGKITKRGGNGRGLTLAQQVLRDALGEGWRTEYAFHVKGMNQQGYPTHYKIDIANLERRIAIEVDGGSHQGVKRRQEDQKKQQFLERHGWRVFRFRNKEVIQQPHECLKRIYDEDDCPIDAVVVSVEPVSIPDNYVYDITVEDCHNFYANGILVHNCQDLNSLQQEISAKMLHPEGRVIFVGDPFQSIYAFSGADSRAFENIKARFKTEILDLNICYRCPSSHIALVQSIVPTIETMPGAIEGTIEYKHLVNDLARTMTPGSMVICRLNAPLLSAYFQLIIAEKPAIILGRSVGKSLVKIVDKVAEERGFVYKNIGKLLTEYHKFEKERLEKRPNTESKIAELADSIECLQLCAANFNCLDVECFKQKLEALFVDAGDKGYDPKDVVTLCTVHKAKGLEADHIGIIYQRGKPSGGGIEWKDIMPLSWEKQRMWEKVQEANIKYVALTRAKKTMTIFGGYKEGEMPDISGSGIDPDMFDLLEEKEELMTNMDTPEIEEPQSEPVLSTNVMVEAETTIAPANMPRERFVLINNVFDTDPQEYSDEAALIGDLRDMESGGEPLSGWLVQEWTPAPTFAEQNLVASIRADNWLETHTPVSENDSPVDELPVAQPRFHGLEDMIQPPGESVAWANWLEVHKADVVILDTETTDKLDKKNPLKKIEIVSIAVIDFDGNTLLNTLIKPVHATINPEAAAIHGITLEKLEAAGATDFAANWDAIKRVIENKHVVIYNRDFDKVVLGGCVALFGLTMPHVKGWHCAMLQYVAHNPNKLTTWGKRGGWWKLTEALEQEGITPDENAHDALADVLMTRQLIQAMATNERDKWSTKPAAKVPVPVVTDVVETPVVNEPIAEPVVEESPVIEDKHMAAPSVVKVDEPNEPVKKEPYEQIMDKLRVLNLSQAEAFRDILDDYIQELRAEVLA